MFSSFVFSVNVCSFPALPTRFIEDLRSQEATEGTTVTLRCQMSKAASVEWRKGSEILRDGDRYSLRQDGATCELQIRGLAVEDAGEYSCMCGQERTSATLSVKGKDRMWPPEPKTWCLHVVPSMLLSPHVVSYGGPVIIYSAP